jgi:hypothetical protein
MGCWLDSGPLQKSKPGPGEVDEIGPQLESMGGQKDPFSYLRSPEIS